MRARNFQTPALPAKPNLLRRVDNVGAITSGRVGDFVRTLYVVRTVGTRRDQVFRSTLYYT